MLIHMAKAKFTVLKKIDVMSLAKIFSLLGVIVGFLAGLGIAFASSMAVPIMPPLITLPGFRMDLGSTFFLKAFMRVTMSLPITSSAFLVK